MIVDNLVENQPNSGENLCITGEKPGVSWG